MMKRWILVEVLPVNDLVEFDSGVKLAIDTSYKEHEFRRHNGTVVGFSEDIKDLQKGDEAFFHYLTLQNSIKNGGHLGDRYIIPYTSVITAKRGDDMIMHNDWLLVEPLCLEEEEVTESGIISKVNEKFDSQMGQVAFVNGFPDDYLFGVEKGDFIMWEKAADTLLEYEMNQVLDRPYFRMKYEDVFAII